MQHWFKGLSTKQLILGIGTLVVSVGIVVAGYLLQPGGAEEVLAEFTVDMSIQEIAPQLGVTGKGLARELELPLRTGKGQPLRRLGIDQATLDHAVEHIRSHDSGTLKYCVFAALVFAAWIYLLRLGRPDQDAGKKHSYPRIVHTAFMVVAVVACGVWLGKSPNPMEGTVKVFKAMVGLYPSVWSKVLVFGFFAFLAVVGNKLICGWACPFGALQELLYKIPLHKKLRRWRVPFWFSNTVRLTLFAVVLLFLFAVIGGQKGLVLYHYLNPFNLFNFDFDSPIIIATVIIALVAGLIIYRPFCQMICPFGLVSWILEQVSLTRVRIDLDRCTSCGACDRACPTHAIRTKLEKRRLSADCFSCGRCLNTCPVDAITYSFMGAKPSEKPKQ